MYENIKVFSLSDEWITRYVAFTTGYQHQAFCSKNGNTNHTFRIAFLIPCYFLSGQASGHALTPANVKQRKKMFSTLFEDEKDCCNTLTVKKK